MDKRERLKEILVDVSILKGDFTLASGKKSSYYIDARLTTLHPAGLSLVAEIMFAEITKDSDISSVGGPTMGADPIVGALIALSHAQKKPLNGFLVRKQEKQHGTGKLIEGNLKEGDRVAIVEDVVTSGGSLLKAADAVENQGGVIKKVFVIVDREEGAEEKIRARGYDFYSIFKISELL